jgi:signal transduction histidine kinase
MPLPVISGDGDRLAQVFTNLVDNALKFTPDGGKITISTVYDAGKVIIKVSDTGVGISPEDQQRIFERFFQVDKSRSGGIGRGVGLGLAISRQIVLAHHGEISLESEPGKGTVFQVILPVAQETPLKAAKK